MEGNMFRNKLLAINLILVLIISGLAIGNSDIAYAKTHSKTKVVKTGLNDTSFIDTNALTATEIQNILSNNGSFLKDYKEGGRSAAQIIKDAANGHGDASGSMSGISVNKTISPVAILATLQKEQSLITMRDKNDGSLRAAMGYACPDGGGCNAKYAGFTKQVENGAWQLRFNYERAKGHGFSDYQVGQTIKIDGTKVKLTTRFQSSLLRYTPHNGSNFTTYFNKWTKAIVISNPVNAVSITSTNTVAAQNCLVGSKSTRRACRIAQTKTAVNTVIATVNNAASTVVAKVNCALGSKSTQRTCRIQQAKLNK